MIGVNKMFFKNKKQGSQHKDIHRNFMLKLELKKKKYNKKRVDNCFVKNSGKI